MENEYDSEEIFESDEDSDEEFLDELSHGDHKENGNTAYKSKDYRGALAHYTLAIETLKAEDELCAEDKKLLATYYNNRAAANSMILKYEDVISDCDEAISILPSFIKAYVRKAKCQTTLGLLDDAMATYNKALIHDPNDAPIIRSKNELNTYKRRFELALELLSKTTTSNPYLPLPSQRDANQALQQINAILLAASNWKEPLVPKVKCLITLGRVNEAYPLTTSLMRLPQFKHHSELILLRAHILFAQGNLDDAVKHLRQILSMDPDHALAFKFHKALRALGKRKEEADTNYKSRNYDAAIKFYTEALDLDACTGMYRAKLFFNRASAHANLRKHSEVISDCSEALRYDNEYLKAILRRASSYLCIGGEEECQKAISDYTEAMEIAERKGDEDMQRDLKKKLQQAQVQLKRSKQKDFYKILNAARDASDSEIKKNYRKAALKWHPDRHANSTDEKKKEAEKLFRDINLAYEVLSDPEKKRKYDSGVDIEDLDNPHAGAGGHGMHGHGGGIDPNVLFQMFMQQQGGGGGGFHFG